jgi:hypothetical protein
MVIDHNALSLSFPYLVSLCVFMYLAQQFEHGRCPSHRVFLARQRSQEAHKGVIPSSSWFFSSSTSVPRFMMGLCSDVSEWMRKVVEQEKQQSGENQGGPFLRCWLQLYANAVDLILVSYLRGGIRNVTATAIAYNGHGLRNFVEQLRFLAETIWSQTKPGVHDFSRYKYVIPGTNSSSSTSIICHTGVHQFRRISNTPYQFNVFSGVVTDLAFVVVKRASTCSPVQRRVEIRVLSIQQKIFRMA